MQCLFSFNASVQRATIFSTTLKITDSGKTLVHKLTPTELVSLWGGSTEIKGSGKFQVLLGGLADGFIVETSVTSSAGASLFVQRCG